MTAWEPKPGDRAWLVPTLATAPTEAYREPRCTVEAVSQNRATVLVGKKRITTDRANVRATQPEHKPKAPRPAKRRALDGCEEHTLW